MRGEVSVSVVQHALSLAGMFAHPGFQVVGHDQPRDAAEEAENPYVFVSGSENENQSIIVIKNSRREGEIKKRNGQYLSTKHQGTGLGIISAQKTAEKNGGSLITEATEKTFTAALFLKKNG